MNVIFHEKYYHTYESDPAAAPGRMEPIIRELKQHPDYRFITPAPATSTDILQAHSRRHIDYIKQDPIVYEMALLAAGGCAPQREEPREICPCVEWEIVPVWQCDGWRSYDDCIFDDGEGVKWDS